MAQDLINCSCVTAQHDIIIVLQKNVSFDIKNLRMTLKISPFELCNLLLTLVVYMPCTNCALR